jgi:3',5'-cyclic AMP phosphodiesterase CpdA
MNWRCALVSAVLASASSAAAQGIISRGPYVVDAASTSVKVCWREGSLDDFCRKIGGIPAGAAFAYQLPNIDGKWVAKTLAPASSPTRFAVFGDLGDGSPEQARVARVLEAADVQFALLTGDIVYPKGENAAYDKKYFGVYRGLLTGLAFFPAIGNHDYGNAWTARAGQKYYEEGYLKVFQRPKYYSFDAGDVHFVSLDTNEAFNTGGAEPIGLGSEQRAWLEKDLAASKAVWKMVFLHVPLYSTSRNHGDNAWLRRVLQPVFEKHGVSFVFAGHDHVYQRSKTIKGVTYVTVGTGGGRVKARGREAPWLAKEVGTPGLVVVRAWSWSTPTASPSS